MKFGLIIARSIVAFAGCHVRRINHSCETLAAKSCAMSREHDVWFKEFRCPSNGPHLGVTFMKIYSGNWPLQLAHYSGLLNPA